MSETPQTTPEAVPRDPAELQARLEEAEARAREARQEADRYRQVFEHSNDAVLVIDPMADRIVAANERACRMLGYDREELLAQPVSAIHPHEMDGLREFAERVFRDTRGETDELTCLTKSGQTLASECSAAATDVDGQRCLIVMVRDVTERNRLALHNEYLHDEIRVSRNPSNIIGGSPALRKVLQQIEMVAPTDASVLITGDSGTGKELVATAIHDQSARKGQPLVTVNCASIPAELFESEFFGHMKGSFTGALKDRVGRFELANGGTLFLDEIGEIPLNLQGKLLRVLQEGSFERVGEDRTRKVDVRILAATNRDIRKEVQEGRFRQDLYYRLSVFPIEIPPLRERRDDIAPLAHHFIDLSCKRLGLGCPPVTPANIQTLERYDWPGNVRELQNVVERAMILGGGRTLNFGPLLAGEDAPAARSDGPSASGDATPVGSLPGGKLSLEDLERLEREVILDALHSTHWKIYGNDGAAARLGLKPTTLTSRMRKMGLKKPSLPAAAEPPPA